MRLLSQFQDGDKMSVLKDRLTVSVDDIANFNQFLAGVFQDLKRASDGQQLQQANQAAPKPQAQPPQSNEANSTKRMQAGAQAHNKLPQRPTSKEALPPAAPTSTQAPFQFGAASPDGKPVYATTPQLTQDNLTLPRKKIKTGVQTSSPAGGSQTASPQTKPLSPDLRKQPDPKAAPSKPSFPCTAPDCEMGGPVFSSDALRKKHVDEFHMQPFQQPLQFLEQCVAESFDHIHQTQADSVQPQVNAVGGPATQTGKPDEKNGIASRGPGNNAPVADALQSTVFENIGLGNGTIDPQSLFAPAFNFDPIAGGVISNTSLYRSATPNEDTPESSKDSGASEPNSDIPEAGSLDINIDFGGPELYFQDNFNLNSPHGSYYAGDDEGYYAASMIENIVANKSYQIPQSIDMDLYSMDC